MSSIIVAANAVLLKTTDKELEEIALVTRTSDTMTRACCRTD
jgi:hypothetical protein